MSTSNSLMIGLNIVLAVLIGIIAYLSISVCFKERNMLKDFFEHVDNKYRNRILNKKADDVYERLHKKSFLTKVDNLIYRSNIRKHFRYLNSEVFLILLLGISVLVSSFIFYVSKSYVFSLIGFACPSIFIYAALREMARINFDKIDNNMMPFANSLKSSAKIKNSILFMMEEASNSLKEPIRTYNNEFVRDVKRGIPMESAFENYIDKVENIRFKNLLKNLYICSINNADYVRILDKTKVVISKYYEQKVRRRKKVTAGQIGIISIILISLLIIHGLTGITPNFYMTIISTVIGQLLVGYIICIIIFAIYKCITLKDFNY